MNRQALPELPIDPALPEIVAASQSGAALVVRASPGAGKTTRLPPALLAACDGEVWVLEPRRVAARAAARHVAMQLETRVGELVGYQVRGDQRVGKATRLRFVTDGILLRRLLRDPFLEGVAAVVLDEFHERHIEADLVIAMLREIRASVRDDLRIVVMSATLEAGPLATFLSGPGQSGPCLSGPGLSGPTPAKRDSARVFEVPGRAHAVETHWATTHDSDPLERRVRTAVLEALAQQEGDALVFLPGLREIRAAADALGDLGAQGIDVLPLHGSLPANEQDLALRAGARRKVVLATNVAETSVTVPGVRSVIDSGLVRRLRHDPGRGLDVLSLERVSLASADQRRGRAGREDTGHCYRLWTKGEERGFAKFEEPELRRVELSSALLQARAFAGKSCFEWFEEPPGDALGRADELLQRLGACEQSGAVTQLGSQLLRLPLAPRLARVIVEARKFDCLASATTVAALLGERELRPARRSTNPSLDDDRPELLRQLEDLEDFAHHGAKPQAARRLGISYSVASNVVQQRRQLEREAERLSANREEVAASSGADLTHSEPIDDDQALARSLLSGFPDRVARRLASSPERAALVGGRVVRIAAGVLADDDELFLALEVRDHAERGRREPRVTLALPLELAWLEATAPGIRESVDAELDRERGRVRGVRKRRWLDLSIAEEPGPDPDPELGRAALRELFFRDPWRWLGEQRSLRSLFDRAAWLAHRERETAEDATSASADEGLDEASVFELAFELCDGRSLAGLRDAPLVEILRGRQARLLSKLAKAAPATMRLPSGRDARIDYGNAGGPTVAARLQEFFGAETLPGLAGGSVPIRIELLAPNHRAVQITTDLASFWANVYPKVRSELRRRYPKHSWPEDPLTAKAESRPQRRKR